MIGAIEKQKFVYILNRDTDQKLTISSPLEAHKSHTVIFDICGIDVGYENPLFAVIEVDYGEADEKYSTVNTGIVEKKLTYYEMDLGLNHVVRKYMEKIPQSAHLLITGLISNYEIFHIMQFQDSQIKIILNSPMGQEEFQFAVKINLFISATIMKANKWKYIIPKELETGLIQAYL